MKKMIYNKILRVLPATTIFLVSTILAMSTFTNVSTSAFAQSEGTNQTMQKEDQSTNQTSEAIQQNFCDVVTNISKGANSVGSNISTEIAKEVAENIGKKLQDISK
jgi:predicted PurR-regulated permease PerM